MHGTQFGCYFYIGRNQDVDGPALLDPFLSLMAQYCWLFPEKDCLRWLQPEFLVAVPVIKLAPYTVPASLCRLLACILFSLLRGRRGFALGDPGLWRFDDWGHTRTRRAAWVSPGSRIVFGACIFKRVNH